MKNIKFNKKNYIIFGIIIIIMIITLIGLLMIPKKKITMKKVENNILKVDYDSGWNVINNKDNLIALKHHDLGTIEFSTVILEEKYKYLGLNEFIEEIIYMTKNDNKEYNLISKEEKTLTKNNYNGFQLLYETESNQVLLIVFKADGQLITMTYNNNNESFDILLDSVQNIIYNLTLKKDKYKLTHKLDVQNDEIKFKENKQLELKSSKEYEIAANNYLVKYTLPEKFIQSTISTNSGYYIYDSKEDFSLKINVNIFNKNLYEYIIKSDNFGSLYKNYSYTRDSEDTENFKEELTRISDEPGQEVYLYKHSYKSNFLGKSTEKELVMLIYELNKNHLFLVEIEASNTPISKELIDAIKVTEIKNYSSYIKREIIDNKLILRLKSYFDAYTKDKIMEIVVKLPTNYTEIDNKQNMYEQRIAKIENENKVEYQLYNYLDTAINTNKFQMDYYKDNGNYIELSRQEDVNINNKNFQKYTGTFTKKEDEEKRQVMKKIDVTILLYSLPNDKILSIRIESENSSLNQDKLLNLTNFEIKE